MIEPDEELLHAYFDDTLDEARQAKLNRWLQADPANARRFADVARVHDGLRNLLARRASIETPAVSLAPQRFRGWRVAGAVASIAFLVLIAVWIAPVRLSAAAELDRLIEQSSVVRDRTYRIRNLDDLPETPDEKQPPIDGALLHVRHPDLYVLERRFPDGRLVVTGSDGERSWRVPPDRVVRVSRDPLRFRGPVPGNQHGIPFANLRSDLVQLRDAYDITPLEADAGGVKGLLAIKKSSDYRGPNRVELRYDPKSGVIHRMDFSGMPRARGGPDRVSVELVGERDLGPDFFRHESHHDADRRLIEED